jgi:DNA repair protein RadC
MTSIDTGPLMLSPRLAENAGGVPERADVRATWHVALQGGLSQFREGAAGLDNGGKNMQSLSEIGFAQDERGYYTTRHVSDDDVLLLASSIFARRFARGSYITDAKAAAEFLRHRLALLEHEVFAVLWLDQRHRMIAFDELFVGTINGTAVYPREVVKAGLRHNAAAAIICHNHPSGIAEPSRADETLTARLKTALDLVDIRLLDHLIVAGEEVVSFAERGLL